MFIFFFIFFFFSSRRRHTRSLCDWSSDVCSSDLGLDELLRERVDAGVPVIGLCMGMQLLFESTTEHGGAEGIGLLKGAVVGLEAPKVPQIGWNPVSWKRSSVLNQGLPDPCAFYHANSFAPRPANAEDILGTAEYGSEFVSVVERPPIYGLQSHPEKSGPDGLRLLKNFVSLAVAQAAGGARGAATSVAQAA